MLHSADMDDDEPNSFESLGVAALQVLRRLVEPLHEPRNHENKSDDRSKDERESQRHDDHRNADLLDCFHR